MTQKKARSRADIEWENRTLCSDESCIGVIGTDGRCKECGRPYDGEFTPLAPSDDTDEPYTDSGESQVEYRDDDATENPDDAGNIDWENRTLCVDESCIGVIGPDGRCKECGKPLNDGEA